MVAERQEGRRRRTTARPARLHGWTLAGLLETTGIFLSLATITVACVLLLGDPISMLVWPLVAWVVGEMFE